MNYDTATFDEIWKKEYSIRTIWTSIYKQILYNCFKIDLDGKFHDYCYNTITYYKNKTYHRIDGPALIAKNMCYVGWFKNGKLHRTDGPASINFYNNKKLYIWAINDERMSKEKFQSITSAFSNSQNGNEIILL